MNERDKTAQMMQDSAGNSWGTEAHFQAFAALVRADERKACADAVVQAVEKGLQAAIAMEREACAKFLERIDLGNLPPNMALHYGLLIGSLVSGIRARVTK